MNRLTSEQQDYKNILLEQQATLTALVGDQYFHNAVQLQQIAEYTFEDRGIYRVHCDDGQITLIDWDCAGLGPAILDVGYLLLTCHLGKPQLPAMHADPVLIEAVMRGYYQQHKLTTSELEFLCEAVHFETARRVVADDMLADRIDDWQKDGRIQKALARFAVSDEIARIAQELV